MAVATYPNGLAYSEALAEAKARGAVGTSRSMEVSAEALSSNTRVAEREVAGEWVTEAEARAAGQIAEWNAAEEAARQRTVVLANAAVANELGAASTTTPSQLTAAVRGRFAAHADLGDISYGMTAGDKPVICLDGLPNFWVVATSLPRSAHRRLVVDDDFRVQPIGPKTHVSTVSPNGELRVFVQKGSAVLKAALGSQESWESHPLFLRNDLPTGESPAWFVRPSSDTLLQAYGFDAQAVANAQADDAAFLSAMDTYSIGAAPLKLPTAAGCSAIFSLPKWLNDAGWNIEHKWMVDEAQKITADSLGWSLRAYGITAPGTTEDVRSLTDSSHAALPRLSSQTTDSQCVAYWSVTRRRSLGLPAPLVECLTRSRLHSHTPWRVH